MKKLGFLCCMLMMAFLFTGAKLVPLEDEAKELENSKARLIIESYEVVKGEVLPGNEIEVKLVIHNTNDSSVAQNVVLSMVNNQGIAVPVEGKSNQVPVGDILGGGTIETTIPVRITEQVKNEENVIILFYMTFSDGRDSEVTNEAYISFPIKNEYIAKVEKLCLEDECYVNEKAVISSEIKNDGMTGVNDARLHIIQTDGTETVYLLGDIAGGITMYYDHTIAMISSGEQKLRAFLSYCDEEGNEYITQETEYSVRVLANNPDAPELQHVETKDVDKTFLVTNGILIGLALVIIIVSYKRGTRRINSGKEVGNGKRG